MSKTTTNLGLIKPELTDPADITQMNPNWDVIDEKLSKTYSSDNKPSLSDIGAAPASHKHNASDVEGLANIAKTGSYNDLKDVPDIPDSITVDSTLSSTSTNPVQNKVVNSELGKKASTNHASSNTTYGVGSLEKYGHVKLTDSMNYWLDENYNIIDSTTGEQVEVEEGVVPNLWLFLRYIYQINHWMDDIGTDMSGMGEEVIYNRTKVNELEKKFSYGTTDLTAGSSALTTGTLYFVYE